MTQLNLQKIVDIVDEYIDIMLNYRQSGHPGGSRSKVPLMANLLFSEHSRFDLMHPENVLGDRFILSAGHTAPLIYAFLALINEAWLASGSKTPAQQLLRSSDLALLRRHGGLPGHPEMADKTLFMKWNSGPTAHGLPPSVGQALALRRAGLPQVRVLSLEGEGGLTAGASHESKNSAWGLGLGNLIWLVDWNDYGIDKRAASSVVYATPPQWFENYGWRVIGSEEGDNVAALGDVMTQALLEDVDEQRPLMLWVKTRKGRGYNIYDAASHGKPHPMNSDLFWKARQEFSQKYNVEYARFGQKAPENPTAVYEEAQEQLERVTQVLRADEQLVNAIAQRLKQQEQAVRKERQGGVLQTSHEDISSLFKQKLPERLFLPAGEKAANRAGFASYAAWLNGLSLAKRGQPLFLACSADLAESTGLAAFGKDEAEYNGCGWYERNSNPQGVILPQEITEFSNAGIACAIPSVNFSAEPEKFFQGFYGACSTYGSFSYLKYGEMRLFSQLVQDCPLQCGKVLWVAGHSGPETAEDARTHFGIFSPTVTQLFPEGSVINLYPWEYNEVPVLLHTALAQKKIPIIALHLTRPPIHLPDRSALGWPSCFESSKGAYVVKDYQAGRVKQGCLLIQGTMPVNNLVALWSQLESLNLKIVVLSSPELFDLQSADYQQQVFTAWDRQHAMIVSNTSKISMYRWIFNQKMLSYSLTADSDNIWRSGGSVEELMEEAGLDSESIWKALLKFTTSVEEGVLI